MRGKLGNTKPAEQQRFEKVVVLPEQISNHFQSDSQLLTDILTLRIELNITLDGKRYIHGEVALTGQFC